MVDCSRNVVEDTGLEGDFHLERLMPSENRLLPLALLLALLPHPNLKRVGAPAPHEHDGLMTMDGQSLYSGWEMEACQSTSTLSGREEETALTEGAP